MIFAVMIEFLKELSYKYKVGRLMMTNDSILARSFNRHEQKKLGYGAIIGCFVMVMTLCTVFKPYFDHLSLESLIQSMSISSLRLWMSAEEIISEPQPYNISENILNLTSFRSEVYELNGDIRIHGKSATIFTASSHQQNTSFNFTTKPYPRQLDGVGKVRSFRIINQPSEDIIFPHCTRNSSSPAIVFSSGGHTGNHFHDFNELLIPLYLTSREFKSTVLFLVTDNQSWWISKYKSILENLSKYEVIDIDNENEILCFSRVIVGLKAHKELSIDPSLSPFYFPTDFTKFLRTTYSLDKKFVNNLQSVAHNRRPRLLLVSRKKTRHVTNEAAVADMAKSLGFDVDVREMGSNMSEVARFVNTFDVMIGVHGAGFTNMLFLPERAVVIQIIPIGLDLFGDLYFGTPAKDMNLRYLEYKVSPNESSLLQKYPVDSEVFRDPQGIFHKDWRGFHSIYLDNQDVNLDLCRFTKTLSKVLELLNS